MKASFERVAECLYRNHRGMYFALVKVSGKQIKRSLRTKDRATANRLLGDFRTKAERLQGNTQRDLHFEELCNLWMDSIKSDVKPSSYQRRVSSINQTRPYFKKEMVRSISADNIDRWKSARSKSVSARSFNIDLETLGLLFRYARDVKRIILDNPVEGVARKKEARRTHTIPTREQFKTRIPWGVWPCLLALIAGWPICHTSVIQHNLAINFQRKKSGGANGARTRNLLRDREAL